MIFLSDVNVVLTLLSFLFGRCAQVVGTPVDCSLIDVTVTGKMRNTAYNLISRGQCNIEVLRSILSNHYNNITKVSKIQIVIDENPANLPRLKCSISIDATNTENTEYTGAFNIFIPVRIKQGEQLDSSTINRRVEIIFFLLLNFLEQPFLLTYWYDLVEKDIVFMSNFLGKNCNLFSINAMFLKLIAVYPNDENSLKSALTDIDIFSEHIIEKESLASYLDIDMLNCGLLWKLLRSVTPLHFICIDANKVICKKPMKNEPMGSYEDVYREMTQNTVDERRTIIVDKSCSFLRMLYIHISRGCKNLQMTFYEELGYYLCKANVFDFIIEKEYKVTEKEGRTSNSEEIAIHCLNLDEIERDVRKLSYYFTVIIDEIKLIRHGELHIREVAKLLEKRGSVRKLTIFLGNNLNLENEGTREQLVTVNYKLLIHEHDITKTHSDSLKQLDIIGYCKEEDTNGEKINYILFLKKTIGIELIHIMDRDKKTIFQTKWVGDRKIAIQPAGSDIISEEFVRNYMALDGLVLEEEMDEDPGCPHWD